MTIRTCITVVTQVPCCTFALLTKRVVILFIETATKHIQLHGPRAPQAPFLLTQSYAATYFVKSNSVKSVLVPCSIRRMCNDQYSVFLIFCIPSPVKTWHPKPVSNAIRFFSLPLLLFSSAMSTSSSILHRAPRRIRHLYPAFKSIMHYFF